MSRVLFIQNGEGDPPGLFAEALNARGVELEIVHAWRGERVPTAVNGWSGVAVGGGSMSVYEADAFPYLADEIALVTAARAHETPVLGMCLGAQLMAAAFGGHVFPHHTKEVGFFDVRFTPAAETDPLWRGQTATIQPVHWHGDTFTLPPDAVLLGSSEITPHQLFRIDHALYGFQFHLEIDEPLLKTMVAADADGWLPKNGVDPQRFLSDAAIELPKVEPIARSVFTRWAELLS